jgi:CelD/BcsL family acetyltransferase involved in cellulose biosynthesis
LIHEVVQESLAAGLDCDFMTGNQSYKTRLATSNAPLYRICATSEMLRDKLAALTPAKVA